MRVCIISSPALCTPPPDYGGSELQAYFLAQGLSEGGHEVILICAKGSGKKGKYEIYETVPPAYKGLEHERAHFEKYKAFLTKEDFDVVDDHTHFCLSSSLDLERLYFSCHDLLPLRKAPNVDLILARSKFHAEYLRKAWNIPETKSKTPILSFIHNGIDLQHYRFSEEKKNFALFLGRCTKSKGPLAFVEICKRAGIKGVLAGEDSPQRGVEQSTIWKLIKECNENKNLTFLGRVPEWRKVELLSSAKALVSPLINYFAVFDLVQVESLASGCPAFITDQGSPREILGGLGKTSCGYVARDINELQRGLQRFLDGEFEFPAEECRARAEKFSVRNMVERYEKVYGGIL